MNIRSKIAYYYSKFRQANRRLAEKPLVIYGIALLFHLLLLTLHVASTYNLGYFIVVRRISVYRAIQLNPSINSALLATSLTLTLTATFSKRENIVKKALLLVTPLLSPVVLLGSKLALTTYLLIALSTGFFLALSTREVYEGLTSGLIMLTAISIIELLLTVANIKQLELSYLINDLQGLMQPLSPYLYSVTLAFSVVVIALRLARKQGAGVNLNEKHVGLSEYYYPALGSILSLVVYMTPYTILVNPKRMIATTDIVVYAELLEQMKRFENPLTAALTLRRGDRFLYMLLLHYLQRILGLDSWTTSTLSGWLWTPLLVFSTWYTAKRLYGDKVARYVALITPLSTQLLGFLYGGFQANQLNVALLLLSMGLLAESKVWRVVLGSLVLALSAGVHLWSWIHIAPAIVLWMLVEVVVRRSKVNFAKLSLVIAVFLIAVIVANSTGAFSYVYEGSLLRVMEKTINTPLEAKLSGLLKSLSIYVWGSLNNPILFVACIGGQALRARRPDHTPLDYLNALTLIGVYLLSPDITMVSRLILNAPVHVLAGIALENSKRETKIAAYSLLLFNALYMALNAPPK